jgi:hypothetical protein
LERSLLFNDIPSPQFGIYTGMCRNCFKEIWMNLTFNVQLEEWPDAMSLVMYQWMLVEDFVDDFNQHHCTHFCASELVSAWLFSLIQHFP